MLIWQDLPDALMAYNIGDRTLRDYKKGLTLTNGHQYIMKFYGIRNRMG